MWKLFNCGSGSSCFTRGGVLPILMHFFIMATLTALQKRDGGVQGTACGPHSEDWWPNASRSSSARMLKQHVRHFRLRVYTGGVDCVGHAVRSITEGDPNATLLSIDGVRWMFLRRPILLLLVRVAVYSQPSRFWSKGTRGCPSCSASPSSTHW